MIENRYRTDFIEIGPIKITDTGTVYNSLHKSENKMYAIKKIASKTEKEAMDAKEILLLPQLSSDFVVTFIDTWIENNYNIGQKVDESDVNTSRRVLFSRQYPLLLHIQMEICPLSLRDAIESLKNEFSTDEDFSTSNTTISGYYIASELMYEILECVHFLHSQTPAIIHRDLKPENFLLTNFVNNRFVKISDFSLSTMHKFADQSHTKSTGSKNYRAIEVDKSTEYSTKADIWSVGIILQEIFHINVNTDQSYSPVLQPKMDQIKILIEKMLSMYPKIRPNCDQVLSEIHKWLLSDKQLLKDDLFSKVLLQPEAKSIEENFIQYFIQNKYKVHKSLYETIESSESKYKNEFIEICPIGEGGFGTVFKSVCISTKKTYAIKKVCYNAEERDKVVEELNFLTTLNNEFVVKYYDSWHEHNYYIGSYNTEKFSKLNISNKLYFQGATHLLHIQMELCLLTLRDVIKIIVNECKSSSIIGYYVSSELFYEILECIKYLHEHNPEIIHRDLKPENFLISNCYNRRFVKISDFGLSTYHKFDMSHSPKGTLRYMAPELNNTRRYTTKADIYSLGIIMHQLFNINLDDEDEEAFLPLKEIKILAANAINGFPASRPDCDKMLSTASNWRLSDENLSKDSEFHKIINRLPKLQSIEEGFIEYFIQNKY